MILTSGSQHIVSHTFVYNLFNWLNINMWIQKPTENLRYKYGSLPVMTNIHETMHFKSYIVFALLDEQTGRYFTLCKRIWNNIDEREYSIIFFSMCYPKYLLYQY